MILAGKKNKYELEIMIAGGTDPSLGSAIKKARREIDQLERAAGLGGKDFFGGMSTKGIDSLGKISDRVFGTVLKGSQLAAAGTAGLLGASTVLGMGFESQMSTVQAISQASHEDMLQLTELAKKMGETTQFTAEQAGEGLEYMAMAGWKTEDMLSGLPGIMHLAAASGEDLGTVSDIVTDAMTAFGLSADQSSHFADVLAQASSNSNTNVAMMGNTFKYVAPVAGALGYTIEDVATATGLMANAGIKGESAGTSLRAMLTNLAKPTEEMQGYMTDLGISLVDNAGKMKSLRELSEGMRLGFSKLSEAEKAEYAAGIAGKEGMSGLLAIVNASTEDINKLTQAIDNSNGAAKKMSEIRLDNLKGDLTILSSAAQGLGIEAYGGFSEELRELVQDATGWVGNITQELSEELPTIRRKMKGFGEDIEEGLEPLLTFGTWSLEHPEAIKGTLMGVTGALATFKGIQAFKGGVALLGKLSGMISAWPVAAAGLAVGGIVGIGTAIESTRKAAAKANLDRHFGDITLSVKELEEAARHIVSGGDTLFGDLDRFYETADGIQELQDSLMGSMEEIQKADWKLSMGFDFNESDVQAYVGAVDEYIQNAQQYITDSGYQVKLAVGVVFGEDSEAGSGFAEGSDAFYQSLYQQLQPLEQQLREVMTDITENGLDLPRQQLVDQYLTQISDITSMITDAENAAKMQMIEDQYTGADLLSGDTFQNLQQSIQEYTDEAYQGIEESYEKILTSLHVQRQAGEQGIEGGISQEEFESQWAEVRKHYYEQQAQIVQNGYQMMEHTIMSTYGDEIRPALEAVQQKIQAELPRIMEDNTTPEQFVAAFNKLLTDSISAAGMDPSAREAVKLLVKNMAPTQEDLEQLKKQMEASGFSPPDMIAEAFDTMSEMKAAAGDEESIWKLIGDSIADNEDYALLTATVEQQTGQIPDIAIQAIGAKNDEVQAAAEELLQVISDTFAGGVEADIPITLNTVTKYRSGTLMEKGSEIPHHAKGGLISKPTLSWFAENGPEMAIPLDRSERALNLWKQAGQLLGAYDRASYSRMSEEFRTAEAVQQGRNPFSSAAPVFSPVIQVSAGQDVKGQVMEGLKASYEQFVEYMERFQREQYRQAF